MKPKNRIGLTILSTVIGVSTLLLFTTLVQQVFFKNVHYCVSDSWNLSLKTLALFAAGTVVGFKTSLIVVRTNFWPHILLTAMVAGQFFFAVGCPWSANPLWFDILQSGILISGLWIGSYGALKFPLAPV